jgi:hypothetical protein
MNTATAEGSCSVEDALSLSQFLHSHHEAGVNLGPCTHLPRELIQVLLAERPNIIALPEEVVMRHWVLQVLGAAKKAAHHLQFAPPARIETLNP